MDQNPNIVPGDRWGFSGDLIRKVAPEEEKWTEAHAGSYPLLSLPIPVRGVVGLQLIGS